MAVTPHTTSSDALACLVESIEHERAHYDGLITVICPTNTTALFFRRQYELHVRTSVGVRFTTHEQVNTLLEDAAVEHTTTMQSSTIAHFDTCAEIARILFPRSSMWVKTPLIRSTLELLYSMEDDQAEKALNDYELVRACFDAYKKTRTPTQNVASIPIEEIIGRCIVLTYASPSLTSRRFAQRYGVHIAYNIVVEQAKLHSEVEMYETPHDEVDSLLERYISMDQVSAHSCAMIVPNNEYKRLALMSAKRKGIALAGTSPTSWASHPFCELAHYFLTRSEARITYEDIKHFVELFPWIRNTSDKHPFIACSDAVMSSRTMGEYFTHIVDFIRNNVDEIFFAEESDEFEFAPPLSLTQNVFALLQELSTSTTQLSPYESFLFLQQQSSAHALRIGALGSGLYIALPDEVYATSFDTVFIAGMSDTYVTATSVASSLIPRDQYSTYLVEGKAEKEMNAQQTLSWLRNCSRVILMSSSEVGLDGKKIVLPHWAQSAQVQHPLGIEYDFMWDDYLAESSHYISQLMSSEMNNVNALAEPPTDITVSATGIGTLAQCPSQFFYRHILGARSPDSNDDTDNLLPTVLGTLVHGLLDDYTNRSLSRDELVELMRERVHEKIRTGELSHRASSTITTARLTRMIDNFIELDQQAHADSVESEVVVENTIASDDHSLNARGKIDRIQHKGSSITLVDYKTGKVVKSADTFNFGRKLQLGLYALMMEDTPSRLEYWHLDGKEGEIDPIDWNDEIRSKAVATLFDVTSVLETGTFIARDEFVEQQAKTPSHKSRCESCDVEPYCYDEQRLLWPRFKKTASLTHYANATGEDLFEDES